MSALVKSIYFFEGMRLYSKASFCLIDLTVHIIVRGWNDKKMWFRRDRERNDVNVKETDVKSRNVETNKDRIKQKKAVPKFT